MTDQTPPPDHPTPPTAEGVGPVEGATPPPPPPAEPPGDQPVGAESPPPAPKSRRGLLISLIAGLLALALIGGALALFFLTRGPDKHSITVTSTAGGMKRDTAQEKKLKKELDATGKQFETQFKVTSAKSGLYKQDNTSRGPKGQLLFMGFRFKTPSEKNPANLVKKLRAIADGNKLKVTNVPVGDAGGKAICIGSPAAAAQKTSSCFWATRDTGGGLFPNVEGYDSKQMSKLLLDVRSDIEKTE
ncbi:MAG: hypothetical protein ABIR34_13100 [Marmoricola sp.]